MEDDSPDLIDALLMQATMPDTVTAAPRPTRKRAAAATATVTSAEAAAGLPTPPSTPMVEGPLDPNIFLNKPSKTAKKAEDEKKSKDKAPAKKAASKVSRPAAAAKSKSGQSAESKPAGNDRPTPVFATSTPSLLIEAENAKLQSEVKKLQARQTSLLRIIERGEVEKRANLEEANRRKEQERATELDELVARQIQESQQKAYAARMRLEEQSQSQDAFQTAQGEEGEIVDDDGLESEQRPGILDPSFMSPVFKPAAAIGNKENYEEETVYKGADKNPDAYIKRHHSQWSRQDAVRDFEKAQAHLKITPAPGDKQQIKTVMAKCLEHRRDAIIAASALNTSMARGLSHRESIMEAMELLDIPIEGLKSTSRHCRLVLEARDGAARFLQDGQHSVSLDLEDVRVLKAANSMASRGKNGRGGRGNYGRGGWRGRFRGRPYYRHFQMPLQQPMIQPMQQILPALPPAPPQKKKAAAPGGAVNLTCYKCGLVGHIKEHCPF